MLAARTSVVRSLGALARGGSIRFVTYEPMAAADLRKGMIYKGQDNLYKEATDYHCQRTGRGSATYIITHTNLSNGLIKEDRFSGSSKVTRIEPDKRWLAVTYIDKESQPSDPVVNLVDEEYDEVTLPMSKFGTQSKDLADGAKVTMWTDGDAIVKLQVTENKGKRLNL